MDVDAARRVIMPGTKIAPMIWEADDGGVVCQQCPPKIDRSCAHVHTALLAGRDVLDRFTSKPSPLPRRVLVPVVSPSIKAPALIIAVIVDAPDAFGMRAAYVDLHDRRIDLAYIDATEGRWTLRGYLVDWLVGAATKAPRCVAGCGRSPYDAGSYAGLHDTWLRYSKSVCLPHAEHADIDDASLIPDV